MIGQTISHYKIIEKIGEGGMGKVYLAEDTKLQRNVALKFLPSQLTSDNVTRRRFLQEAQAASALNHSNIGAIHEINDEEENAFIVMDYYAGGTLRDLITENKPAIDRAIKIAICIASGLQQAHDKDIIHRDIKPENILFSKDGEPKIIDFGLAKILDKSLLTEAGSTMGTVAYMSPEQAQGIKVDQRTDIWALGVILYEMLAAERPFKGEYEQAVMYSIMNEEPEFISKVRSDVPLALEKVIGKALTKNCEKRFQSMEEMCGALQNVQDEIRSGKSTTASAFRLGRKQQRMVIRLAPVFIVALMIIVYFAFIKEALASPVSIVLLPLENISRDDDQEWFTEGMTDALITDLARIGGLRIISRSSVMKFKGSNKTAAEIAEELGVSYVIEGSVVKTDELVNINIRLLDAASDDYLWASAYERNFKNILALQGQVAREITREIKVNLTPGEENRLSAKRSVNPEAYEAYLKGNFYLFKLTREALETSLHYLKLATKLDPNYAPAYAGIALAWSAYAQMGYMPMKQASAKAKESIEKALKLDSTLPEIYYMKAVLATWSEWNWELALTSYEKAIRLNPNMAEARAYYSHILFILNRPAEARPQIERALELDPFNPLFQALNAMTLIYQRRYDEAIGIMCKTLEKSPGDPVALSTLRTAYHQKKMYKEAIDIWRICFKTRKDQQSLQALDLGYTEGGYSMALRRVAESRIEQARDKFISPWPIGTLYTRAGMPNEALDWLEKALEAHDPNIPYLNIDPIFDNMREMPRFKKMIKKIGLSE